VGFSATSGSKTHEPIATKLGVRNYVRHLNFQIWEQWVRVWGLGACVKYHCLWLSFLPFNFSFLHHAYRSPRLTDFHDLCYQKQWPGLNLNGQNALLRKKSFYGAHQKKNWIKIDPYNISGKCRSMILVSRNIRYMRIIAGFPRGGASNDSAGVEVRNFHCFMTIIITICSKL